DRPSVADDRDSEPEAPRKPALANKPADSAPKGAAIAAVMAAGQKSPGAAGPTARKPTGEGAKAAIALTETQLAAMRAMRTDNSESRKRWIELVLLVLFLLALQLGAPLLAQPKLARAQELFGDRMKLVAGGFAVSSVIVMIKVWAARMTARSPLL